MPGPVLGAWDPEMKDTVSALEEFTVQCVASQVDGQLQHVLDPCL